VKQNTLICSKLPEVDFLLAVRDNISQRFIVSHNSKAKNLPVMNGVSTAYATLAAQMKDARSSLSVAFLGFLYHRVA
jgi:hypothetical protein